jgi:hypothetical protein
VGGENLAKLLVHSKNKKKSNNSISLYYNSSTVPKAQIPRVGRFSLASTMGKSRFYAFLFSPLPTPWCQRWSPEAQACWASAPALRHSWPLLSHFLWTMSHKTNLWKPLNVRMFFLL